MISLLKIYFWRFRIHIKSNKNDDTLLFEFILYYVILYNSYFEKMNPSAPNCAIAIWANRSPATRCAFPALPAALTSRTTVTRHQPTRPTGDDASAILDDSYVCDRHQVITDHYIYCKNTFNLLMVVLKQIIHLKKYWLKS